MPLYSYQCDDCHSVFEGFNSIEERHNMNCPDCSGKVELKLGKLHYHAFPEGWWRDLAANPIYISDKNQLKNECKKHGCYAPGMEVVSHRREI